MENVLEIPTLGMGIQRKLGLPKALRHAVRDHLKRQFPASTAKHAARHYGLTLDRAREAVAGRVSLASFEAILQRGGLAVALPIVEAATGECLAQHLHQMRTRHEENGRRIAALVGSFDPVATDRHFDHPDDADAVVGRGRAVADRRSRQQG